MKKLLSVILVAVMLVTTIPIAFAEGNTYKVGDIVQFGSYPQSEVKDEALVAELNALAPEWDDWTSYGYYRGDGSYGSMKQYDWIRFVDIYYKGYQYRCVRFTKYRPAITIVEEDYTYQDDNGYHKNINYWFKFEPLEWRILNYNTGLIFCNNIIDAQPYCNTIYRAAELGYEEFNDSKFNNYASDYETSSIRLWLNTDFYNTAFSDYEKELIDSTELNNESYCSWIGDYSKTYLDSCSTNDKIFLLSCSDVFNSDYGFDSNLYRQIQGSDYALSQGLYRDRYSTSVYEGNCLWLLRSPGDSSGTCCSVDVDGSIRADLSVCRSDYGIRPALNLSTIAHMHNYMSKIIKLPTHIAVGEVAYICTICKDEYVEELPKLDAHYHNAVITNPTCTTQGYTTYTCECGDTYVADYVNMLGHNMSEYLVTIKPTCTSMGVEISYCSRCDHTVRKDIAMLRHSFTDYISDGKATCTTDGLLIAKCDNCDATDSIPEKGGHSFRTDWTLDVEPTCTDLGSKSHHCNTCDEKADVTPIAKIGHTYTSYVTEPTCTDKGLKVNICSCGDNYTEVLPAKGHTFSGSICKTCGYDKADSCSCNCHKSGLSALLWKILNIFYKLFKLNSTCNCGVAHY